MELDYQDYRYIFCVVIGIAWGIVYLVYKSLSGTTRGFMLNVSEKNDEGDVKIFNFWNLGLFSFLTMVGFLWASSYETSTVSEVIRRSWDYLVEQKILIG
ncbi:MAG: hypothetical protein AAF495_11820 [Pseudomonadota bacterium]